MASQIDINGTLAVAKIGSVPFDFKFPVAPISETEDLGSGVKVTITVDNDDIVLGLTALGFLKVRKTFSEKGIHPYHVAVGDVVLQGDIILS